MRHIEIGSVWYNHSTNRRYRVVRVKNDKGTQVYTLKSDLDEVELSADFISTRMVLDSIVRDN